MSWDKIVKTTNSQLDKAKDFRYFAMLASFVLFLDYILIIFNGQAISQITYGILKDGLHLGQTLIFFGLYAFFLSFFVPLVQYVIRMIAITIPFSWLYYFYHDKWKDVKSKDCFYLRDLKKYAVKNNNSVAYNYYRDLIEDSSKEKQMNHFCLAFLISILLDIYAYGTNGRALVSAFKPFFDESADSFLVILLAMIFYALCIFCFYFGVIKGCGFSLQSTDKYYFEDHEFK